MSIHKVARKSGTSYQVKLRTPEGKQYSRTFRTRKEAQQFQVSEIAAMSRGTWLNEQVCNITFQELAERWLKSNEAKRQTSRQRDVGILKKHLLPELGAQKIRTIKRADIISLVNTWISHELSASTIRRHMAVLSAIFNMAIADELLHKSPTHRVAMPRIEPSCGRALSRYEAQNLLGRIPESYFAFVYIMLTTGIRWSEAVGLQVKHFCPLASPPVLIIEQGLHEVENGYVLERPKSAASHRSIVLSSSHVEVIAKYLKDTNRTASDAESPLFQSPKGGVLVASNFRNRIWIPATKAAGLDGLRIKDMRKTAATNLLQGGLDSKTVTAVLGHEDIRTTLNNYAKTTQESLLHAAKVLVEGLDSSTLVQDHLQIGT
jgi:site-specific recombinase XerD